ncbi:MAG TPA: SH3 domain-containing protein [Thermomicrobiaceae bacterium]|nr:SH3 domain-containing protein [Thermomicrobiaceae bacterium]
MGARRGCGRTLCGALLAATLGAAAIAPAAADTNLAVGGSAVVSQTGGEGVHVRNGVGSGAGILTTIPEGASVTILGGPKTAADGSAWYNVQSGSVKGWVISTYLSLPPVKQGSTLVVTGTNGNGLRLRNGASLNSSTLTVMPDGTQVSVVGADKTDAQGIDWANVSYQGQTGYASRQYLTGGSAQTTATTTTTTTVTVSAPAQTSGVAVGGNAVVANTAGDGLNLRASASFSASVQTVIPQGGVVHVSGGPQSSGGATWWNVDYNGTKGWVDGAYLSPTNKQPAAVVTNTASVSSSAASAPAAATTLGQKLVAEAMQYVGYPYAWGGTTPAGFDCSGFVYYVVNQVTGGGFSRDITTQATSGSYVDASNLQPGDLVFFQNTYQWGLSHVGIYIGNGQFISAENSSTGVAVANMWDSYWGSRYYTARRLGP